MTDRMHISQVEPKNAQRLAAVRMIDDWYHNNIQDAARKLFDQGHDAAEYITQWSSGNSCWELSNGERVTVEVR